MRSATTVGFQVSFVSSIAQVRGLIEPSETRDRREDD